jgi:hypothetical protein
MRIGILNQRKTLIHQREITKQNKNQLNGPTNDEHQQTKHHSGEGKRRKHK